MMRMVLWSMLFVILPLMTPVQADAAAIGLTIQVIDADTQAPIVTAAIRNPEEAYRHPVNHDGSLVMEALYLKDGSIINFSPGLELAMEISAPGYVLEKRVYTLQRRKNRVVVSLQKMELMADNEFEDVMIQFKRTRVLE